MPQRSRLVASICARGVRLIRPGLAPVREPAALDRSKRHPRSTARQDHPIGSIRRECVDHIVVLGEAHLRRILTKYAAYYNELRTHRSLGKDTRIHRAIQHVGCSASVRSWADFITIIVGSNFRYTHLDT
jgi:hypothetical protein